MPQSPRAAAAVDLVRDLQRSLVDRLENLEARHGTGQRFTPIAWQRGGGEFGGGERLATGDTPVFNRASVNVSVVHYDTRPDKKLGSANALSTIVHPVHPLAPSMHMHISWTEMKDGSGYWRIMSDLNPSHANERATARFRAALADAAGYRFDAAAAQGDRYFYIPALHRHRGVAHFYLEAYRTNDDEADLALARRIGEATIEIYPTLVDEVLAGGRTATSEHSKTQLQYHTLYLLQVLTLDRGTTSGLLVHDDNDEGILGSLPARVDRALLASWRAAVPPLQRPLIDALVQALPDESVPTIDGPTKRALARAVRAFYQANPEALDLQARGDVVPPTVANHGG